MTLLSDLARAAITSMQAAVAPVRAALYLPIAHTTQSEPAREAAEAARAARMKVLAAEDIDEDTRGRAINALDDIDAGLRQLAACLDPSHTPGGAR